METTINTNDVTRQFIRASGPGGQHRNKVESGVRLTHGPTGIVVTATERRRQSQNLDVAWRRLEAQVVAALTPAVERVATAVPTRVKARRSEDKRRKSRKKADRRWRG